MKHKPAVVGAGVLASGVAVLILAHAWNANADTCVGGGGQLLGFDLIEVTEDGAPVGTLAYDKWNMDTLANDDTSVEFRAEFNDFNNVWVETYVAAP